MELTTAPEPARPTTYRYTFCFGDGSQKRFAVNLDPETLELIPKPGATPPFWAQLSYYQCPNCPLQEASSPTCPVAVNIAEIVEFFRDSISHDTAEVRVETEGRVYAKETTLQQAVSSLIGIYMVTSGCPVMNKLRPMVDTHLPFMSSSESVYRMISMYLTAQFFLHRRGVEADWNLDRFREFLAGARETNSAFCRRLQSLGVKDASLNALNSLNAMGEITRISLETGDFERWERIFLAQWGASPAGS